MVHKHFFFKQIEVNNGGEQLLWHKQVSAVMHKHKLREVGHRLQKQIKMVNVTQAHKSD